MNIKKNIPNLFTLCNLLCGCIAIVFAFEGNLVLSAYMVGTACIFDFIDGFAARILKTSSELGKQLDSLADMVSFGVVPGVMMFKMLLSSFLYNDVQSFNNENTIGCSVVFLVTIFSAIRLAKFNIDTRQTDSFIGLPTPANTIFIASLPIILNSNSVSESFKHIIPNPSPPLSLTFISSFLLVAPLPLFALKFKNFSWADNKVRYLFLVLTIVLLILFQFVGIPLIIILYIVLSVINTILTR